MGDGTPGHTNHAPGPLPLGALARSADVAVHASGSKCSRVQQIRPATLPDCHPSDIHSTHTHYHWRCTLTCTRDLLSPRLCHPITTPFLSWPLPLPATNEQEIRCAVRRLIILLPSPPPLNCLPTYLYPSPHPILPAYSLSPPFPSHLILRKPTSKPPARWPKPSPSISPLTSFIIPLP